MKTDYKCRKEPAEARRPRRGQSIVEFALVLPLLLLFFLGLVEVGSAMFSYLRLAGANREGARLASRGRFENETIAGHIVAAGGLHEPAPGVLEPHLRTTGPDTNMGIIITRINIPMSGDVIQTSQYISGTITYAGSDGQEVRPISLDDGRLNQMSTAELLDYLNFRRGISGEITEYRAYVDYEVNAVETFVIVETFYAHETTTHFLTFLGDTIHLYFDSTLRILEDSRLD